MTRAQAKANLIGFGIAEPTEEQITNYLNQVNGESQKEKDRAEQYKKDAARVAELQKQLDELNSANLSDIEKANKATEDALNKVAELEKQMARANTLKSLADKGIVGDDAEKLLKEDGTFDIETLGKILSDRAAEAATKKEQEIANNSTNPNGGSGGNDNHDDKTEDVKNAEAISFGSNASTDEKDYYKL